MHDTQQRKLTLSQLGLGNPLPDDATGVVDHGGGLKLHGLHYISHTDLKRQGNHDCCSAPPPGSHLHKSRRGHFKTRSHRFTKPRLLRTTSCTKARVYQTHQNQLLHLCIVNTLSTIYHVICLGSTDSQLKTDISTESVSSIKESQNYFNVSKPFLLKDPLQ